MAKTKTKSSIEKYIHDLDQFTYTSNIITEQLYKDYNRKIKDIPTAGQIAIKPITDNINKLLVLSKTIKQSVDILKNDFGV